MARGCSSYRRSRSRAMLAVAALLVACLLLISIAPGANAMSKKEARAAKKAAAKAAAAAASSSSSSAANDQTVAEDKPPAGEVLVTCGSALKLEHANTGRLLHSQNIAYGGEGSGQMGVTAVTAATDPGGVWLVKPALVSPSSSSSSSPSPPSSSDGEDDDQRLPSCRRGQPLKSGDVLRIQHAKSRRWLHSHLFPSPISRQLEVSAFGGETQTDAMDEWILEVDPSSNVKSGNSVFWKRDGKVSLKHVGTGGYLSSHERAFGHPIAGQNEVFGKKSGKDWWKAGEGVFFETTTAATSKK